MVCGVVMCGGWVGGGGEGRREGGEVGWSGEREWRGVEGRERR